uniref:hypothetical protein n=1 Tax=Streptomyces sp. CA-141956 TaxID=3240051 RepID=UPI003F490E30
MVTQQVKQGRPALVERSLCVRCGPSATGTSVSEVWGNALVLMIPIDVVLAGDGLHFLTSLP